MFSYIQLNLDIQKFKGPLQNSELYDIPLKRRKGLSKPKISNDLQSTTNKSKDQATRTLILTMCSGVPTLRNMYYNYFFYIARNPFTTHQIQQESCVSFMKKLISKYFSCQFVKNYLNKIDNMIQKGLRTPKCRKIMQQSKHND